MKFSEAKRPGSWRLPASFAALLITLLLLPACSSGLQVRSDEDPRADFGQYRSFNFFDPMGIEGGYNSPVFGEYFRESISNELRQRGYKQTARSDLIVNVTIRAIAE